MFDCAKCLAYCCTHTVGAAAVTRPEAVKLARAAKQPTGPFLASLGAVPAGVTTPSGERLIGTLPTQADPLTSRSACLFLDVKTRRCTVWAVRPGICQRFPFGESCGHFEALQFHRKLLHDDQAVLLLTPQKR